MILKPGEKIHVIHRRYYEKEARRHFVGTVDSYEGGVARVTGHVYSVDKNEGMFERRSEERTRIISLLSGDLLVNVLPPSVQLDKVVYKQIKHAIRVTDGSNWYLDLSETAWI
jgi:hypothetical protein